MELGILNVYSGRWISRRVDLLCSELYSPLYFCTKFFVLNDLFIDHLSPIISFLWFSIKQGSSPAASWTRRADDESHGRNMMTSSNGNIFRVTGPLCGEFTGHRAKASDAKLWCFFYLRLNKWLSKQSWGWWFETPSHSLWRHRNDIYHSHNNCHFWFSLQVLGCRLKGCLKLIGA